MILDAENQELSTFTNKTIDELLHKDIVEICAKIKVPVTPHLDNLKYIVDKQTDDYIIGRQYRKNKKSYLDVFCFKNLMVLDWDIPKISNSNNIHILKEELLHKIKDIFIYGFIRFINTILFIFALCFIMPGLYCVLKSSSVIIYIFIYWILYKIPIDKIEWGGIIVFIITLLIISYILLNSKSYDFKGKSFYKITTFRKTLAVFLIIFDLFIFGFINNYFSELSNKTYVDILAPKLLILIFFIIQIVVGILIDKYYYKKNISNKELIYISILIISSIVCIYGFYMNTKTHTSIDLSTSTGSKNTIIVTPEAEEEEFKYKNVIPIVKH